MLDNKTIKLNDLLKISSSELYNYKLHLATYNGKDNPLDLYVENFDDWLYWNQWRNGRDDFPRKYIFSMIENYHKVNKYIFGGVFRITHRYNNWEETNIGYELEIVEEFKPYIGRLEIDFYRYQGLRGRAFKLENYIDDMVVSQIYEKEYRGVDFPGYDNICLNYQTLELIIKNQKSDWKVALENHKGIYVIVDKSNGKKYIGSAYGVNGIWARWNNYVYSNGHGYNDELVKLISTKGSEYAKENFQFSILELLSMKVDDDFVVRRENYWKNVLQTRSPLGYNKN